MTSNYKLFRNIYVNNSSFYKYVTYNTKLLFFTIFRVNVASLLMIILMGKMEYATDILQSLLHKLINKSVGSKHPQLMLRRTETVVEKMLSNWMALCMYNYLKDHVGPSLFLLFKGQSIVLYKFE